MSKKAAHTERIARFALNQKIEDLSADHVWMLKKHLLDSLASMISCAQEPPIQKLRRHILDITSGGPLDTWIGRLSLERAVQLYTAMIRYPDFMDNFLGKEATCHPSDNIGGILAVSQLMGASGDDFL